MAQLPCCPRQTFITSSCAGQERIEIVIGCIGCLCSHEEPKLRSWCHKCDYANLADNPSCFLTGHARQRPSPFGRRPSRSEPCKIVASTALSLPRGGAAEVWRHPCCSS